MKNESPSMDSGYQALGHLPGYCLPLNFLELFTPKSPKGDFGDLIEDSEGRLKLKLFYDANIL